MVVAFGCGGDDGVDCSEWVTDPSVIGQDAGPLPDGGGYALGDDVIVHHSQCD